MPDLINLYPFTFSRQYFWVCELRNIFRWLGRPGLPFHTVFSWQILWGKLVQNWAVDKNPWRQSFLTRYQLRSICFFFATCPRLIFKTQRSNLNHFCLAFECTSVWLGLFELAHFGHPFTNYLLASNHVGQKFIISPSTYHVWNFRG